MLSRRAVTGGAIPGFDPQPDFSGWPAEADVPEISLRQRRSYHDFDDGARCGQFGNGNTRPNWVRFYEVLQVLLNNDPSFLARKGVNWWMRLSVTFDRDVIDRA